MRVLLPGGSGQVGTILARALHSRGEDVTVLSRKPKSAPWHTAVWEPSSPGTWQEHFNGADAVIHLSGRSVNCRYNTENRRQIMESRTLTTRAVGEAIARAQRPPQVWLNAATATIYRHALDRAQDEFTGEFGGHEPSAPETWAFSVDVAKQWEEAFAAADTPATRKVAMRSAMVMSPDVNGVFDVLLGLVRHGLGGTQGGGNQYVSWIHDQDFVRAVLFLLDRADMSGPVNLCASEPLRNRDFMAAIRAAYGRSFGLPAGRWMLEVGAAFLRTETELILKSRRVIPSVLERAGFDFAFPAFPAAAADLVARRRATYSST